MIKEGRRRVNCARLSERETDEILAVMSSISSDTNGLTSSDKGVMRQ